MHSTLLACAGVLLSSCAGSPPAMSEVALPTGTPERFGTVDDSAQIEDGIADQWWQAFGDEHLNACIEAALQHNRDLQAASARLSAALAQSELAGAGLTPQVDVNFNASRARQLFLGFPFGSGSGVPSSTFTTYGLNLNVSWEVDLWGRLRDLDAAGIADLQAQTAEFEGAIQSLLAQTCKAYFAVVEARQQLALSEATAETFSATANDVRDRFQRGVRPAVDTFQAETNLRDAQANAASRRRQLHAAVRQLEILMGRYPANVTDSAAALDDRHLRATLQEIPIGLPSELLARRPDLAAAERRLVATGCRVDAARADLYPRISLTATGGTTSLELGDLIDDAFRVWSLGANLLQPLLRGGALRAELARSEAVQQEAIANYGAALLRAFAEVEIALADANLLETQETAAAAAAASATQASDLARDRYQRGVTDFLAVADFQRRAFSSQAAAIAVRRQRIDNRIDLILALGGGFTTFMPRIVEEAKP